MPQNEKEHSCAHCRRGEPREDANRIFHPHWQTEPNKLLIQIIRQGADPLVSTDKLLQPWLTVRGDVERPEWSCDKPIGGNKLLPTVFQLGLAYAFGVVQDVGLGCRRDLNVEDLQMREQRAEVTMVGEGQDGGVCEGTERGQRWHSSADALRVARTREAVFDRVR